VYREQLTEKNVLKTLSAVELYMKTVVIPPKKNNSLGYTGLLTINMGLAGYRKT
jgi:hypothetical protein